MKMNILKAKTKDQLFDDFSKKYNINKDILEKFILQYKFFHKPNIKIIKALRIIFYLLIFIFGITFIVYLSMGGDLIEFYNLPSFDSIRFDNVPKPEGYNYKIFLNLFLYIFQIIIFVGMIAYGLHKLLSKLD